MPGSSPEPAFPPEFLIRARATERALHDVPVTSSKQAPLRSFRPSAEALRWDAMGGHSIWGCQAAQPEGGVPGSLPAAAGGGGARW